MKMVHLEDYRRNRRLDFGNFVDKLFWFVITAAALYCATQLKEMGKSVEELNKNMALVIYQMTESQVRLNNIDARIDKIEGRRSR